MANKNLILVEGENEEHFLRELKPCMTMPMEIKKFNVLQNKIPTKISGIKYDKVYFLFDYDVIKNGTVTQKNLYINTLENNLRKIVAHKGKNILIQCDNFEDEFIYIDKNISNLNGLCKIFKCKSNSISEFKNKFNDSRNLLTKKDLDLELEKLYTKFSKNSNSLGKPKLDKMIATGSKIFSENKYKECRK